MIETHVTQIAKEVLKTLLDICYLGEKTVGENENIKTDLDSSLPRPQTSCFTPGLVAHACNPSGGINVVWTMTWFNLVGSGIANLGMPVSKLRVGVMWPERRLESHDIQCAGSDTRPPMLDRTDFASWQQRIRMYCRGKENGVNILKSIDEGPFQMGTFRETLTEGTEGAPHLGPERPRVYSDLSPEDKERYNADIRATNILLQGLPKDIYSLTNHYTDAKDIWDNVKMLLEGSKLTKEDHESQLYDDFEHFRQKKEETIHDYYVRFVTAVKLNRGLRDSNYDQLYAYLKQHEAHANENKMMLDRFTQHTMDPLALMLNNVQGRQNRGQGNNARGGGADGYEGAQNRVGNANPGQARQIKCYNCNGIGHIARNCTQHKRPQNSKYFKDKMLLMQAQENGVALDEEQLLFIVGGQDNTINEDVAILDQYVMKAVRLMIQTLSDEVFFVASTSELNVSRFTEMQKAYNVVKARCLEVEAELSNLRDNIHKDNYNKLLNRFSNLEVKPKVLALGKYAIDVEPIPPRNRNNREVHLVYLRHLKESVDTLREIVEDAKVERPLDRSLAFACLYTKHSQELLEYVFGTCPKVFNQQDKKHAHTPRKKKVTFEDQRATSSSNTHKHIEPMHTQKSNVPVPPSTGVNSCTDASGS
ncbi:retrovirus-related pol polyprotein from transposon TNT 1-94 [Tanacetum coccineum]